MNIFWETEEGIKPRSLQMVPKRKDLPTRVSKSPGLVSMTIFSGSQKKYIIYKVKEKS